MNVSCAERTTRCAICRVFSRRHEQLRQIIVSLTHEAYEDFWQPYEAVGALYLHRWSNAFLIRLERTMCKDTPKHYQALLNHLLALHVLGVDQQVIAASLGVMFLYLAVYTSAEVTSELSPQKCLELIEHFGDVLTRLTLDILPERTSKQKTP